MIDSKLSRRWPLVVLQFCIASFAYPAALHVILVADTVSDNGAAAAYEMDHVQHELELVAGQTGLEFKKQLFRGNDDSANVLLAVKSLQPGPDDSVVFYFIGHGYRSSQKEGPWPLLFFSREPADIDFQDIVDQIIGKHPRFGLLVADCCNNVIDDMYGVDHLTRGDRKMVLAKGYRRLFLESTGIVVVCAAKLGDYAYCDGQGFGHIFSQAFWRGLRWEIKKENPSWRGVLDTTSAIVNWIQFPYYEILEYNS